MKNKLRRKVMGLIFGSILGGSISMAASKKSHAFGIGLSPEDIFEMFIEKAGSILMRFLGYRFMSNLDLSMDRYQENSEETNKNKNADMAKALAMGYETAIEKYRKVANHEIELECITPKITCANGSLSQINNQNSNAVRSAAPLARERLNTYLDSRGESKNETVHIRNETLSKLLNSQGDIEIQELTKLVGVNHFTDNTRAEEEMAALVGNHISTANKGKIEEQRSKANNDIVIDALMMLFMQRVKTTAIDSNFMETLSGDLKQLYPQTKLSTIEMLHLETMALSSNDLFNNQVADSPSITTATAYLNPIQALQNKLELERYKVSEMRNLVSSLQAVKES